MKVKDLIEILKEKNPEADVLVIEDGKAELVFGTLSDVEDSSVIIGDKETILAFTENSEE